jgi:peptidoglycan/xylan/chitin deacetylase (PgdA/CDA1 family)
MNDQELLEMHSAGFEIGSQGMSYVNLTKMPTTQAAEEIGRSRILLEILLNAPVLTFAYPFGKVVSETKRLVAESGYTIGCAMDEGTRNFGTDLFDVRRISMTHGMRSSSLRAKLLL